MAQKLATHHSLFSPFARKWDAPISFNWFKQLTNYGKIEETTYDSLATAIQDKEGITGMALTARDCIRKEAPNKLNAELQDDTDTKAS